MRQRFGDDWARIAKLSIIEETATGEKTVSCGRRTKPGHIDGSRTSMHVFCFALEKEQLVLRHSCQKNKPPHLHLLLPAYRCAWHTWR